MLILVNFFKKINKKFVNFFTSNAVNGKVDTEKSILYNNFVLDLILIYMLNLISKIIIGRLVERV